VTRKYRLDVNIADQHVVVTGGANGIGRALCRRLASEGARAIVVADLDGDGAKAVANEVGGTAVRVDVSVEDEVVGLVETSIEANGPIDLFCANAGVGGGAGLDEGWELAIGVNVMAHVHAARLLVPQWLERGRGYWMSTASAAGLLTQIGSGPYAVSKHGAVAFAEWLSVTYGDRGIGVSCLCPMGVNTPLLHGGIEPDDDGQSPGRTAADVVAAAGAILEPEDVADIVVEGLRAERFLILPHPEVLTFFQRKGSDYDRWLAGMRRLQAAILEGAS
jgi:NAD(P)-dependent dehydrogenase (short-subunit alcohol dehydrogenase family)